MINATAQQLPCRKTRAHGSSPFGSGTKAELIREMLDRQPAPADELLRTTGMGGLGVTTPNPAPGAIRQWLAEYPRTFVQAYRTASP